MSSDIEFLRSDRGKQLLERLAVEDLSDNNVLPLLTLLRKTYTAGEAGAALEMARLRVKAVDKFGVDAARLFFTRQALEQASDPLIRRWRGEHFHPRTMIDACCSIGSDALGFAERGAEVLGLDIDPVRVAIANHNAEVLGITSARFMVADVRADLPQLRAGVDLIFFDPARRTDDGKRIYDVESYEPPLSVIQGWRAEQIVVKLSPGVDLSQLEAYRGTVDFISVRGDLKEALLTVGRAAPHQRRATLLEDEVYRWEQPTDDLPPVCCSEPRAWLLEPDPALIRAGLVESAAVHFGASQLDESIAYLTADSKPVSPWVRTWKILDWMPFNLKKLRAYLRERGVGAVTVKKRGTAVTPEVIIPQLKLKGEKRLTLVLTRCRGSQITLICEDLTTEQDG